MTWTALLVLALGTYLLRVSGLLLADRLKLPENVQRYFDLAATTLLFALVATATITSGTVFAGWARPAGVAAGGIAAWRRLPFVVVVLLAATVTSMLRAFGVR
jgi:branched chain amino acid efflux pump